ncbi:MAG TPA: transcription initiation factor TFIIIB [Kosmotogaceae bacterium]|nr:transcription initiation factor TFIIIB [Kosmotogaceae bacterium]
MVHTDKCPNCGSMNIGEGTWTGYAALMPKGKKFSNGAPVEVSVCRDCGHLFCFRTTKPEKF